MYNNNFNLLDFYHDLTESIIAALEAKDEYTANHSRRVSEMSENLCSYFDISASEIEKIHIAAHVHDIGKIGIPDNILTKKGLLNEEEWKIMRQHPEIGAKILNSSKYFKDISDIVLHHHERWDGNGYPNKISKLSIPFGSRIIAVCDSIDAMLSERPYRKLMTMQECKNEIKNGSEIMYDPFIVNVILKNWNKIVIKNYNY